MKKFILQNYFEYKIKLMYLCTFILGTVIICGTNFFIMNRKYIIEKEHEVYYTNREMTEASDVILDAFLFTEEEFRSIVIVEGIYRTTSISAVSDVVLGIIADVLLDEDINPKENETPAEFIDRMKEFMKAHCQEIVDNAISQSKIVWDIEKHCVETVLEEYWKRNLQIYKRKIEENVRLKMAIAELHKFSIEERRKMAGVA